MGSSDSGAFENIASGSKSVSRAQEGKKVSSGAIWVVGVGEAHQGGKRSRAELSVAPEKALKDIISYEQEQRHKAAYGLRPSEKIVSVIQRQRGKKGSLVGCCVSSE